jgi:TPR repeat protein
VHKDSNASFYNIELAAKGGYPPAINKLGDYYFSGFGCKKDK